MSPVAAPPLLKRPTIDEGDDAPTLARSYRPYFLQSSVEVTEDSSDDSSSDDSSSDDSSTDDEDQEDTPYGGTMDMSYAVDTIHRHWDSISCYGDIDTSATCSTASSSGADYSSYYSAADHYIDTASYSYHHAKKASKKARGRSGEVFTPPLRTITLKSKSTKTKKLENLARAVTTLVGGVKGAAVTASRRGSRGHHQQRRRSFGSEPASLEHVMGRRATADDSVRSVDVRQESMTVRLRQY